MSNFIGNRRWLRPRGEAPLPLFDSPRRSPARELPPASRSSRTSQAAAVSVAHAVGYIEDRIVSYLLERRDDGATGEETAIALELRPQTCSARFSELSQAGRIIDSRR